MASKFGQDGKKERTDDVRTVEDVDFAGMLLPEDILSGLSSYGFKKPSPIQLKAIPLGRCGFDLILEAKSGTGKTCVFSIIALDMVSAEKKKLQVLILVPTREIALQVTGVIRGIGSVIKGLNVHSFIGGTSFEEDKKKLQCCHIAVGAPGRVRHLMEKGVMKVECIRLCVLDEADKLLESAFVKDLKYFFSVLPPSKQMVIASATMPAELDALLSRHMKSPVRVCPHGQGVPPILLGLRQVALRVPAHPSAQQQLNVKVYALSKLLSLVPFQQCIVFSNYLTRAEGICHELERRGWPCRHTAGVLDQRERMEALSALVESRCRVLLSTDLTARGVDAPGVDLVVSLDLPSNGATYLHRIGRAGRFGSYGLAVTLVAAGTEMHKFSDMLRSVEASAAIVTPEEFPQNLWNCDLSVCESVGAQHNHVGKVIGDVFIPPETPGETSRTSLSEHHISNKVRKEPVVTGDSENVSKRSCDVNTLSEVLMHARCGQGAKAKSFQSLLVCCESGTPVWGNASVPRESAEEELWCDVGESLERVLGHAHAVSGGQLAERLEELKLVDLRVALKELAAGEVWPSLTPRGPIVAKPRTEHGDWGSTSWNMKDCDVSLFGKAFSKHSVGKRKSGDGGCLRSLGSHFTGNVDGALNVADCRHHSWISGAQESSVNSNEKYDAHPGVNYSLCHRRQNERSSHHFNQWYEQIMFQRCVIEYNAYWNYMFRK